MKKILTIARYELLRMIRVKQTLWLQIVLPILIILILGNALSGVFSPEDRELEPIAAGVWNADNSEINLAQALHSEAVSQWLEFQEYKSKEKLIEALEDRDIAYGVIVPQDFSNRVLSGQDVKWELYPGFSESDSLVAESVILSVLDQLNFTQAVSLTLGSAEAAVPAAAMSGSANEAAYVEMIRPDLSDKDYSAMQYYAAAMLVMFILYSGLSTGISIVFEKESHTLDRLYAAPLRPYHILTGKMIGASAVALGQTAIIILFTKFIYGVDWGDRYLLLILASLFTVIASISIAVIIAAFVKSAKTLGTFFSIVIIVMTFLSGGFAPEIGDFLERIGEFTLSYWASRSFIHLILESESGTVFEYLAKLGIIALGLLAISVVLGRRAVSHE